MASRKQIRQRKRFKRASKHCEKPKKLGFRNRQSCMKSELS